LIPPRTHRFSSHYETEPISPPISVRGQHDNLITPTPPFPIEGEGVCWLDTSIDKLPP
jgi:hypothetical protein